MAVVIDMPKLSDTMEEGGISEWFKKEGEFVEEGEPLLAIETDKATMEYASPEEGTILKILVEAGKTVALKKPIVVLGEKGESFDLDKLLAKEGSPVGEPKQEAQKTEKSAEQAQTPPQTTKQDEFSTKHAAEERLTVAAQPPTSDRVKASPLAKKIAREKGVDLTLISGSGPHGRVIQRDVVNFSPAAFAPSRPTAPIARADEKIPHTMMRKTIAKRLLAGKNDAPHFYLTVSANMEAMLKWRQDLNQDPRLASGEIPKVSVNDLIILATAKALRSHPQVNASWHDDFIMQHGSVDISMAVALPSGLVTPVIPNADQLGVREIASLSKALAAKAKDGKLTPAEYSGGTFTISNLGMTKVEAFTAIINPPQACILAVGTTQKVPHVDATGAIVAQARMKMTMSCDHRVVDGMVGARFLETLVAYLENPLLMLS